MSHFSTEKSLAFPPLVGKIQKGQQTIKNTPRSHRETQKSSGSAQLIFKTLRLSSILLLLIHNEPFGSSGHTCAPPDRQEGPLYQSKEDERTALSCLSQWMVGDWGWPIYNTILGKTTARKCRDVLKISFQKLNHPPQPPTIDRIPLKTGYQLLYHHFCGSNYPKRLCSRRARSQWVHGSHWVHAWLQQVLLDSGKTSDVIQNASFQKMFPAHWSWAPSAPNGLEIISR